MAVSVVNTAWERNKDTHVSWALWRHARLQALRRSCFKWRAPRQRRALKPLAAFLFLHFFLVFGTGRAETCRGDDRVLRRWGSTVTVGQFARGWWCVHAEVGIEAWGTLSFKWIMGHPVIQGVTRSYLVPMSHPCHHPRHELRDTDRHDLFHSMSCAIAISKQKGAAWFSGGCLFVKLCLFKKATGVCLCVGSLRVFVWYVYVVCTWIASHKCPLCSSSRRYTLYI